MFRSEAQRARACHALCSMARLERLWTSTGPTPEAIALFEAGGGPLSSGEQVVLFAAWAFWNGDCNATLADVIFRLDPSNLRTIATLMLALGQGGHAIERWIATCQDRRQLP